MKKTIENNVPVLVRKLVSVAIKFDLFVFYHNTCSSFVSCTVVHRVDKNFTQFEDLVR